MDKAPCNSQDVEVRKGPWTMEEDSILINYIANHGEAGAWNSLAKAAGLKRTGKSCRLRWLNYLRPDLRRGNITPEEQLLIMELHAKWGNRWSKIAKHLPGRTDNEIKNYWRTRIQKHIKQAENCSYQSNPELHSEQAGTSQVSPSVTTQFLPCTAADFMETYDSLSSSSFNHLHGSNMGTLTGHATMSMAFEPNENYWGMEDMMWSDPCTLFNGN